jgi:hypothetical protein
MVLWSLALVVDRKDEATVSRLDIHRETGLSLVSVDRAIGNLKRAGLLQARKAHRINTWILNREKLLVLVKAEAQPTAIHETPPESIRGTVLTPAPQPKTRLREVTKVEDAVRYAGLEGGCLLDCFWMDGTRDVALNVEDARSQLQKIDPGLQVEECSRGTLRIIDQEAKPK